MIGLSMRHLIGLIAAAALTLPVAAAAGMPEPEPVEITHEGTRLKGLIYRPEGAGPFADGQARVTVRRTL